MSAILNLSNISRLIMNKKIMLSASIIVIVASFLWMNISAADTREKLLANKAVGAVTQNDLQELLAKEDFEKEYALIDVRTPLEHSIGHIPSSINIPHYKILNNPKLLDQYKDKKVILYCHSGVRVGKVADLLTQKKHSNLNHLRGDISKWKANKLPLE